MTDYTLYTDGSAEPNPGPCGSGAVMLDEDENIVWTLSEFLGAGTNNIGEFTAILRGLMRASEMGAKSVKVYSDSEIAVRLLNGSRTSKKEHLMRILTRIQRVLDDEPHMKVNFEWVKAHNNHQWNEMADRLAGEAVASNKDQGLPSVPSLATHVAPVNPVIGATTSDDGAKLYLKCPFAQKEEVKKLGAKWDPNQKMWWVVDNKENQKKFAKWIDQK